MPASIQNVDAAEWDRVLNVNLRAVFLLTKEVFPDMRARGGGAIINIGPVAGRRGWANAAAYCASKFALTGLTHVIAAEGRNHRIRACLLYPEAMNTNWGVWSSEDRDGHSPDDATIPNTADALPAEHVAQLVTWIALSPPDLVLNEVTITPLLEQGWP